MLRLEYETELPQLEWVTLILRISEHATDRATIANSASLLSNPRIASYEAFDPGLADFRKWLSPEQGSDSPEFERAVARLLTFSGFAVDSFAGDRRKSQVLDAVAYLHPGPVVLAIECTDVLPERGATG